MIIYAFSALVVLLIGLLAITDKYNPVLQFNFITGLGFLFFYEENYIEEGKQVRLQLRGGGVGS